MSAEDISYYRQRAETERELAQQSTRANVATIHQELARLYEALADEPAIRPKLGVPSFNQTFVQSV